MLEAGRLRRTLLGALRLWYRMVQTSCCPHCPIPTPTLLIPNTNFKGKTNWVNPTLKAHVYTITSPQVTVCNSSCHIPCLVSGYLFNSVWSDRWKVACKLLFDLYLSDFQWTWPLYKTLASHVFFSQSESSKRNYCGSKNIKENTWFQISSNYEQVTWGYLLYPVWSPRKQ